VSSLASKGPVSVTFQLPSRPVRHLRAPDLAKEAGHPGSGNYGDDGRHRHAEVGAEEHHRVRRRPSNVTIFGESAGAIMIGALVGSPQAKGLFHRAIAERRRVDGPDDGADDNDGGCQGRGAKALEMAGIKSIAELRAKPIAELPQLGGGGLVIDGYLIPRGPLLHLCEWQAE
jgi:para-nitrobenzyl esterase